MKAIRRWGKHHPSYTAQTLSSEKGCLFFGIMVRVRFEIFTYEKVGPVILLTNKGMDGRGHEVCNL